VTTLFAAL
jgi:hypothetical protein